MRVQINRAAGLLPCCLGVRFRLMRQRLWPVTGSTREEIRQMLIDNFVQATLEPPERPKRMSRKARESRERIIETLFQAAAAEAEGR
jgi:hypothetical protein